MPAYRSISDVLERNMLQGEFMPFEDVLRREVLVTGVKRLHGSHGDYLMIEFQLEGDFYITTCGGVAVVDKLWTAREHFPLTATFFQKGRYYDVR